MLRVTGLCEGNSPVTGEFPAQGASNAENASIWWRHNGEALENPTPTNTESTNIGNIVCVAICNENLSKVLHFWVLWEIH